MAYRSPGGKRISRPKSKNEFGCARQYQTDPNQVYFGWTATNYLASNPGCNNGSGVAMVTNTSCCNWDTVVGLPKLGPGMQRPLAPADQPLGKTRFGCAQEYQGDASLPYFGWYAYNYDPLADGCDGGNGQPSLNNTDCCMWDIITGGMGKVGPGYTTKKEIREPILPYVNSPKKIGCAQETCNDINSSDYGCYHKPFYGLTAFPYNNPLFYHVTNDGCPNAFGFPQINNIDCCECDTPTGTGATGGVTAKLGPGYNAPLQADEKPIKWAYGCAQEYQSNPNLPYYGWYAMNYSQGYPGCDVGTGFPDPNNTDCCDWDILLGSPRVGGDGTKVAPRGFHFMPDGSLMSNADMYKNETKKTLDKKQDKEFLIQGLSIDTSDIPSGGARRGYVVSGNSEAYFTVEVSDADGNHYDFYSDSWVARSSRSERLNVGPNGYIGYIDFSGVATKLHTFTVRLFAEDGTKLRLGKEVRNKDGSLNVNLSGALNHRMVEKIIFQNVTKQLTLSCVAPSLSGSGGVWQNLLPRPGTTTGASITSINIGSYEGGSPFEITIQAGTGKSIAINRQPAIGDFAIIKEVTIGSSPVVIPGEDLNVDAPKYHRWPINNVAGLSQGMILDPLGSNVTANSEIKDYIVEGQYDVKEVDAVSSQRGKVRKTIKYKKQYIPAVETTGPPTLNQAGSIIAQAGIVTFNNQQVEAFKDDSSVPIYGYGEEAITSLGAGFLAFFKDVRAEILPGNLISTTVTSDTSKVKNDEVIVSEMD